MASNGTTGADNTFGPNVQDQRGGFDFTLLFEDGFLAIAPASLLLIAIPLRTIWLWSSSKVVSESSARLNKVAFLSGFAVLQLTILLLWAINSPWVTIKTSLPAAALDFAAASALCVLSYFEHSRSVRPSFIINVYLLVSIPFDVARSRTLWLMPQTQNIALVLTISTVVKLGVLFLEASSKRGILLDRYRDLPPEATSGLINRSVFWWLNPLLKTGFVKTLLLTDLYTLDPEIQSQDLLRKLSQTWDRSNKHRKHSLSIACASALKWPFLISAVPRLILIGFKYSQPFLLQRTVNYVQEQASQETYNIGWGLVGAYAIVYVGIAVFTAAYMHLTNRLITMLRGSLVSIIYAKTIDVSITTLDESGSMTLMSADVERISQSFIFVHDTWATFVEVGIAIYILEGQLGLACVGPAATALASVVATLIIARLIGAAQKLWLEAIQSRIDVTAHNLGAMRSIKLLGLADLVLNLIQGFRTKEVDLSTRFRKLMTLRISIGNFTQTVAPLLTFGIFAALAKQNGQTLTAATAFAALSVLTLISVPMAQLVYVVPQVVGSFACFDRIQNFLQCPSRRDHRLSMAPIDHRRALRNGSLDDRSSSDIELQSFTKASKVLTDEALVVQDGNFGWSNNENPVLHNISIRIKTSDFVIVAGPVGSGKSTLMKGLLGETPTSKGFVYTTSLTTALADQDAWVQNASVRSNIVGLANFDQEWYASVIDCCALDEDLQQFPKGDATVVGSRGISLSGGQKQRIAMARAIYQKTDIAIFDDVFSGLDVDTEEKIFDRLFSKGGLLRRLPTTVILVTHAAHRLSYADHIIVLSADGTIAEQGSWELLRSAGGYVQGISKDSREMREKREEEAPLPPFQKITAAGILDENTALDLSRKTGDWQVYRYWIRSLGLFSVITFILGIVVLVFFWKFPELWVKFWTSSVATNGNKVNTFYMSIFAVLAIGCMISLLGVTWLLLGHMIPRSSKNLHAQLLDAVMNAPLHFFTKSDSGSLLNRFSNDISLVDVELPYAFFEFFLAIFMCTAVGLLMSLSARYFAAVLPFVIIALYFIQRFYLQTSRQIRLLELEARAPLYTQFQETLNGLATIRAFGWSDEFRQHNLRLLDESQKPFYLLQCIQRWLQVVLDLIVAALAVIMVILIVTLRTKLDAGLVGLGLLNIMSFNEQLAEVIKHWTKLETSIGAIARIRSFITSTPSESESEPNESFEPPESWPSEGSIELRNFTASYDSESRLVLEDVNLYIAAGSKVGICGRSGSGKSSLLASMLHLLEYRDGAIMIDDVNLSPIPRELLRQKVNVIPQEPYFLLGSVRMNAIPWASRDNGMDIQSHSDDEIITAFKQVDLWSIIQQKGGLDAQMNGDFFSHGQRQLFCLARALLRKSRIVILDEVSSSVDIHTDAVMQRIIRKSFSDCTVVVVAHRLKTIVDFDQVVVLGAGGRVIENGDPQMLLQKNGSAFKELYET